MMAAVRDYKKELKESERAAQRGAGSGHQQIDVDDLMDDPELEKLHEARLAALKEEAEKRAEMARKGHGALTEITEGDFLETVTRTERVVCHFFHRDFERCKIMDKHLAVLARQYMHTRFVKLSAPDAPFFTVKLNVKMLPCVLIFNNGVAVDRIVGFEGFKGKDNFDTKELEEVLLNCDAMEPIVASADPDAEADSIRSSIRRAGDRQRDADDEDSDFD